ncbi:energy-coupling factor ABC transporter ATP-binding protein [[Eubacterium] cellulosolvens]
MTLKVERGEFVVLTGLSGCGKTTLCRCLNGLIPHFYPGELKGEIAVAGLDVRQHQPHQLARTTGFVFQNPENQLFSLTVERDLAFGPENLGHPRSVTKKRVDEALHALKFEELRHRAPYELSGGQQQKVAIFAVLTMQPDIIVLDEPTSFLDPKSANEILSIVDTLNKDQRKTIILVEHRLDLASQYANRVIVMDKGKTVLDGPPRNVYKEKAYLLGIGIPKVTLLFHKLARQKYSIRGNPITVEEAYKKIIGKIKA